MSRDALADAPSTGRPEFDHLIREGQAWLAERGETIVGSGSFHAGRMSGSVHTDFGPKDQDKTANQDYVLAWRPRTAQGRKSPRFVLAMADGLTTSFRSECASALACWVGLRALVEAGTATEPRALEIGRAHV
jgi:hypothetical protein